ncbi:hypothetical protein [Devosia marina]|uniref:Uncharacterized protein n=1 Tax=Devosia marina TaxID=2683198 RepID=A0A7X3FS19_9HYPH|nr:hypothetical protein [Devosia marina]MVS99242.1 hypothetical protein [Devosia marina]
MSPANDNAPSPEASWSHIELSAGTVTDAYVLDEHGKRALPSEVGQFRFFIDVVEYDGGRLGLDSCDTYDHAILKAEQARHDWRLSSPVRDVVVESRP